MEENATPINEKITLLRESRMQFLRLHKMLIDIEREEYEKSNGRVSSGQFLNLLLGERNFQWLRKFSVLIVEIDEMFDLDDGFTEEMLERHLLQMRDILDLKIPDQEFNDKYRNVLQTNSEIAGKHAELKNLLAA